MKRTKSSFLFFCFVTLNIFCVFNNELYSQNIQDSTSIYYKSILEIKDVELTSNAFIFFNNKYERALSQNDTIKAAYYLELISFGQFKMTFYHESELTTVKAFQLIDNYSGKSKTTEPRKRLSNQLGMIYRKIEDYENARKFYNQALELNDNLSHKIAIVTNIANTYADADNYKKAVEVLMPYYEKSLELEDTSIKAIYIDDLGYYQSKIGHEEALKNMELALKIKINLKDLVGLTGSYKHLCLFYLDNNEKTKARWYANKVKELSYQLSTPVFILEALELQLKFQDNPDFSQYVALANEVKHVKQIQENKYAAVKYNFQEKEKEAQKLELQIKEAQLKTETEKVNKIIYRSIAVIGLLFSVFLYVIIRIKHRKDKLQQVYNTETRISKKVHDEVANDIYYVMTKMQKKDANSDNLLDDLEDVYNKTRDISKENSLIELNGNFEDHLRDLLLSYRNSNVNIITKDISKVNWNSIDKNKKIVLHRVLQELMTNMRKHSNSILVVLSFSQVGKKIVIDYKDNGIGSDLIKSDGLRNTENRMESINGTITFESKVNNGFKARLTL